MFAHGLNEQKWSVPSQYGLGELLASKAQGLLALLAVITGLIAHDFIVTSDRQWVMATVTAIFEGFALYRSHLEVMSGFCW